MNEQVLKQISKIYENMTEENKMKIRILGEQISDPTKMKPAEAKEVMKILGPNVTGLINNNRKGYRKIPVNSFCSCGSGKKSKKCCKKIQKSES
jgi:hypothetical protein